MYVYTIHYHTGTICYDDSCHLKRYAANPSRCALTATASRLATMNYVIDRMHFKGHVDPWCHAHCDPNKLKELEKVCAQSSITTQVALLVLVNRHTTEYLYQYLIVFDAG